MSQNLNDETLMNKVYEPLIKRMKENGVSFQALSDASGVGSPSCYKIKKGQSVKYSTFNLLMFSQDLFNEDILQALGLPSDINNELEDIGHYLEKQRSEKNIDVKQIVNAIGISNNSLNILLRGLKRDTDILMLAKVSNYIQEN